MKFKPGDYVIRKNLVFNTIEWALIQGYNCNTGIYDIIYMDKQNLTKVESKAVAYFDDWQKEKAPYHRCTCNGRSEWLETSRETVGWEQKSFNVYVNDPNKTKLVTRKVTCPECKGLGWVKN